MNLHHLYAISIGPYAIYNPESDGCKRGKVHTVFRRVINIIWSDGSLSSISRADISNGPANIVTNLRADSDFTRYGINPGTLVILNRNLETLQIGNILISLNEAIIWKSPLSQAKEPLPLVWITENLNEVHRWVNEKVKDLDFAQLVMLVPDLQAITSGVYRPPTNLDPLLQIAGLSLNCLLPAITTCDCVKIQDSVRSLIGLGPGLTPSGDDYLAALLLSLTATTRFLPESFALSLGIIRKTVMKFAHGLTNDLSLQMLLHATKGMGSEVMEQMVYSLFFCPPATDSVIQAGMNLTVAGASSGFDQLLGIMSAAHLYTSYFSHTNG